MEYWTTEEAARALGITRVAVLKRIERGKLPATKFGRDWMLAKGDVLRTVSRRGRPRKQRSADRAPGDHHA
ncbi:MAG: helix-turn-helix domain-containing protein [Armatimonadetes bacterium]|nr:helix-turn-helix domain-containing protein [Armatimonadota bacterium]